VSHRINFRFLQWVNPDTVARERGVRDVLNPTDLEPHAAQTGDRYVKLLVEKLHIENAEDVQRLLHFGRGNDHNA
jgi:hypothetical protein